MARAAEGHVVAKDFDFPSVLFDGVKGVVSGGGFNGVIEFDVGNFCAADDFFLGFGGKLVPGIEIVKILLDNHVASAGKRRIFIANEDGIDGRATRGIFGPVDEAKEITFVEVAKAVDFVGGGDGAFEASHDLRGQLETKVHVLGADMKDQVAWRRDCMARSGPDFPERMEFARTWRTKKTVPGIGTEAHDAGERTFESPKTDGPQKRRKIGAERKDRDPIFITVIYREDEKNGGLCQRGGNQL